MKDLNLMYQLLDVLLTMELDQNFYGEMTILRVDVESVLIYL